MSALSKHCKFAHFIIVKKDNGLTKYCNKDEGRLEGPWTFGIQPARLDLKGDRKRQNMELLEMGPTKALEDGIISFKDYTRVK